MLYSQFLQHLQLLAVGASISYLSCHITVLVESRLNSHSDPINWSTIVSTNHTPRLFYADEYGLSYVVSNKSLKQIQQNKKAIEQSLESPVELRTVKGLMFSVLIVCID